MILIIGAGITGLALGEFLKRNGREFLILEAGSTPGGNIKTFTEAGAQLEWAPNSVRMTQDFLDFVSELGIRDHVVRASAEARKRFVLKNGSYIQLPAGPGDFVRSDILSLKSKLSMMAEPTRKAERIPNESFYNFITRRFNQEVADYLASPMVAGTYAGDAKKLSVAAAFPDMVKMEMETGSVLRGFAGGGGSASLVGAPTSFKDGLGELTTVLAEKLKEQIKYSHPVQSIRKSNQWEVSVGESTFGADQLVMTIPAWKTAELIEALYPEIAKEMKKIVYPPVAVVHTLYDAAAFRSIPEGFGALHNLIEKSFSMGVIYASSVFPGKAPAGKVLITSMVGGMMEPEKLDLTDEDIVSGVNEDHRSYLGVNANPVFSKVFRHQKAIPQYNIGIQHAWKLSEGTEKEGLFLAGNWKGGISVANCVQSASEIADKLKGFKG